MCQMNVRHYQGFGIIRRVKYERVLSDLEGDNSVRGTVGVNIRKGIFIEEVSGMQWISVLFFLSLKPSVQMLIKLQGKLNLVYV